MEVTRKRSIVKTLTWRIIATVTTIIIVFLLTREISLSLLAGGFDVIAKLVLYYVHERAWLKVRWGKKNK